MAEGAIDRIRELDQQRAALLDNARAEALARANDALVELNSLGFDYRIVEDGKKGQSRNAGSRQGRIKDAPCPVCQFRTSPPHDARAHRGQGDRKHPFGIRELKARGYTRID